MAGALPLKYVRFADGFFIVFPMEGSSAEKFPKHADLAKEHKSEPISAGFLIIQSVKDGPEITCHGNSLSLNLGSRTDDPEFFLNKLIL